MKLEMLQKIANETSQIEAQSATTRQYYWKNYSQVCGISPTTSQQPTFGSLDKITVQE
jgi:hypothetical protein